MDNEIKAIVFDIGSVVTKTDFNGFNRKLTKLAKDYKINSDKFHKLQGKYSKKSMIGKLSDNEFKGKILNELDVKNKREFIKKWDNFLDLSMKLDKKVYSLISKLKRNYIIVSFSNVTPMFHKMRVRKRVYRHFKYNLLSHQIGLQKPSLKFYKLLINKAKVKPREIVFIDDNKENLIPAVKLGMKTILYKNNNQLIRDLEKLGVKII